MAGQSPLLDIQATTQRRALTSVSATWQNRAGPQILANQAASLLSPSLNRPLTSPTAPADLIAPGTLYDDRLNQVDVRVAKSVKVGSGRLQGTVSVFNMLNGNTTTLLNAQYGTGWLQPLQIMQGRLVKFGAQFDF